MNQALPVPGHSRKSARDSSVAGGCVGVDTGQRPSFRRDVEGLRGIAVLSLLGVHLFPQWVNGGFIGVDMFFVLSGFLISGSLFDAHEHGRFSLAAFYARRIRRIVPSLCVVLFFSLVFSVLFTYPGAARVVGESVLTGSFFISNLVMWQDAMQLGKAAQPGPLGHLWWLGIELQFCLLWPVLVSFMFKRRRWAFHVLAGLLLVSFAMDAVLSGSSTSAHLMLPVTRFWELMSGALLAFMLRYAAGGPIGLLKARLGQPTGASRWLPDVTAFAGVALLVLALLLIDASRNLPATWSLLPTLGTVALLAAGPAAWVNRVVLSHSILRFYGAISFPLYLWHWPLLVFPTVLGMPLTHELRVIILTASVVLAALTYELVDKQAQSPQQPRGWPLWTLAALLVVALCGWYVQSTDGLAASFPDSMQRAPI